jgi:predicted transposase YdaD
MELFEMPETCSLVEIVRNVLFDNAKAAFKAEGREEGIKEGAIKTALKLLEDGSLARSKILQITGLTDDELKAAENGEA